MRRARWVLRAALAGLAAAASLSVVVAQPPATEKIVQAAASATPAVVARGGTGAVTVTLVIKSGFHIYAAAPKNGDNIATSLDAKPSGGIAFGKAQFGPTKAVRVAGSPTPANVYEGTTTVKLPFTVAKTAKPGKQTVHATLTYQACNDTMCYPPAKAEASAVVTVR